MVEFRHEDGIYIWHPIIIVQARRLRQSDYQTAKPGGLSMTNTEIVIYGTTWCWDCKRARQFMDKHNILYKYIDIDRDETGEMFVLETNNGMRSVPTIIFNDGSILVEPSTNALAEKLGIIY